MKKSLNCYLYPESVAVIGYTSKTGPQSYNIFEVMLNMGFKGKLYPINRKATEILGLKAYPSVLDIPGPVDLVIISTGRMVIPELVRQCVKKGVKGIIVITQGFAETDDMGKKLQDEIMNAVKGIGTRVLGPNTLGVVNNFNNFMTAFVNLPTKTAPVGVICQAGFMLGAHADIFKGCGYMVDVGNSADVSFPEIMEYYYRDDRIKVIDLHIEGIKGGRAFLDLCSKVTLEKPVIVYKTGRTQEGAKAASSHSGSLAGEDFMYAAAFRQAGVIRAESMDDLRDFNQAFIKFSAVPGNRVGVVTYSGGGGIAMLDAILSSGLTLAQLSQETLSEIQKLFPDYIVTDNPVDYWAAVMMHSYDEVFPRIINLILRDPGVDILVCVIQHSNPPGDPNDFDFNCILEAAKEYSDKLVTVCSFGVQRHQWAQYFEENGPVAVYHSPERLARAMGTLYNYYHHIKTRKTDRPIQAGSSASFINFNGITGAVPGDKAMEVLSEAGIPVVKDIFAGSLEEAVSAAEELGYPVALKVISPQVLHKTEAGGVRLDIRDVDELKKAYLSMMEEVREKFSDASIHGVLVQEYISGGIELILGSTRDAEFGPVIVFGTGGIYTEIMQDVAFRIAPVSPADALAMIMETKAGQLLQGVRGQKKADIDAVVKAITSLSDLVFNNQEISEVDINPLVSTPKGIVALDGRIII